MSDLSLVSQLAHDVAPYAHDTLQHFVDSFGGRMGGHAADTASRFLARRFARFLPEALTGSSKRLERLEATFAAIRETIEDEGMFVRPEELDEPAAEQFVENVIGDAVATRSEGRRRLMARMISRRLGVETESMYELLLRDARFIVSSSSESQLALLATLLLISYTPTPKAAEPNEFSAILYGKLQPVLDQLIPVARSRADVERLLAVEALIEHDRALAHRVSGNYVRSRFEIWGMSPPYRDLVVRWNEVIRKLSNTYYISGPEGEPEVGFGTLWLTPKGAVVAALVLEAHLHERIYFPEFEGMDLGDLPSSALIAPFSSSELDQYRSKRDQLGRRMLEESIKEQAPKVVGESMERSLRHSNYTRGF